MLKEEIAPQQAGLPRGTLLFRALRTAVEDVERSPCLSYERLGAILSVPRSTLCRWIHGESAPSVDSVLQLLERVPYAMRGPILDRVLRVYPTLHHPHVGHDQSAVGKLLCHIREPGLSLVSGGHMAVTFLVTALAHSLQLFHWERKICGLDVNPPSWFVPAERVDYVRWSSDQMHLQLTQFLNGCLQGKEQLVLINGAALWHVHWRQIAKLARKNTVLVANGTEVKVPEGPFRRITVAQRKPDERIILSFGSVGGEFDIPLVK